MTRSLKGVLSDLFKHMMTCTVACHKKREYSTIRLLTYDIKLCVSPKRLTWDVAGSAHFPSKNSQYCTNHSSLYYAFLLSYSASSETSITICTLTKKAHIWALHQQGVSAAQISKNLPVHATTVRSVVWKLQINNDVYAVSTKSGRPQKLTNGDLHHASQLFTHRKAQDATDLQQKYFSQVSAQTMCHNLCENGLNGYICWWKPLLTLKHKRRRLLWARYTSK